MSREDRFLFTPSAIGEEVLTSSQKTRASASPDHSLVQLLHKWGLPLSSPSSGAGHLLLRLTYRVAQGGEASTAASGSPAVSAAALRFHDGLAPVFLTALFAEDSVQRALTQAHPRVRVLLSAAEAPALSAGSRGTEQCPVVYDALTCRWTDLYPLDSRLTEAQVIRCVSASPAPAPQEREPEAVAMPVVRRMEALLPGDVVIADELRALFLQAGARRSLRGTGATYTEDCPENTSVMGGRAVAQGESEEGGSDDDAEDGFDSYGYGDGACLSKRALRAAFHETDRREFLYHVAWRLVAGGGAMNQFEDDYAVYRAAVRDVYKAMVTSLVVRVVDAGGTEDCEEGALANRHGGGSSGNGMGEGGAGPERRFAPEVGSLVYQVRGLRPGAGVLFPQSDGLVPSNLNYCYVVVNPQQQTVVLWYHGVS